MAENKIAKIEVKFEFHIGEEPDDSSDASFICVENEYGDRYIYEAEWLGDLWEIPCHQGSLELWDGERVIGWAEEPEVTVSYE